MASTPDGPTALLLISDLEFGGAQRQVVELANQMDPQRFKIHVCTLADYVPLSELLTNRESRLHIIRKRHKFDFSVVPKLVRLMRDLRVMVVHTFLFDAEFFGRIAARLAGVPAIIGSERNTDYVPLQRHHWAFALTRACIDAVIANSSAGADFNSRTFGVPRSRYRVIHNGVDTNRFKPRDASALRKELGIAEHDRVIGMFASFKEQKNHSLLLRAAPRVIARFPDLRLLFIGDELYMGMSDSVGYHRQIHALVDGLGLREHCLFLGNRSDVENYYSLCDLTVLPSLFEGTPNVALESMASGVPVVATNVSDNALIIPDGEVGLVIALNDETALADRVCRILENKELRTRMAKNARQCVTEHFSGKRLADKTASIYEEVLSRKALSSSHRGEVPDE
jgi:glycosyltransferase involved in cell wall biosynthesis